jgi:hypothetical protein
MIPVPAEGRPEDRRARSILARQAPGHELVA